MIFKYYCEKNEKNNKKDNYEPLKKSDGEYIRIKNIVYMKELCDEVNKTPEKYYVEHKKFNYDYKTPHAIYDHITNYPRMEQIKKVKYIERSGVSGHVTGSPIYKIELESGTKELTWPEYENVIFKKIEVDPNEGGKRRKSRRNRKSKKGKKSRKARKSRRKSNRRR